MSKTTPRAVNMIAAIASGILFCAIAQTADAAATKTSVSGTLRTTGAGSGGAGTDGFKISKKSDAARPLFFQNCCSSRY
jgi:type VI protein secretion system component Hcp